LFGEVRSQVRTLASVGGIRQMLSFPFAIVRDLASKKERNK